MKKYFILILLGIITFSCVFACNNQNNVNPASHSKTFVLVHGAWQGAWVWQTVAAQLQKAGNKVITVELPAHGDDQTPPANVTLESYRDKVIAAINSVNGKVILVGHSMGGMVVSIVAEAVPNKIEKLVYIGAFLPANGQSLIDLAGMDKQSLLGPNLIPSADQLTLDIKQDQIVNIFCQDGSDSVKSLVLKKFRVEPAIPFGEKVSLTAANFGSVNKYYIHTLQDHAVGPDLQDTMVKVARITKIFSLNSSHCPFLSIPDQVTTTLLTIIK